MTTLESSPRASRIVAFLARPTTWVVFSGALFCWIMAFAATLPVQDPDVWWVAAAGRVTLAAGSVPEENLFSFTEPHHPWIMHEWTLGPPYALGLSRFGPAFFVCVTAGAFAIHLALTLLVVLGRTRSVSVGLIVAFYCIYFFNSRLLTPRPSSIALVFPALIVLAAFRERFSKRHLAACALIGLAWANTHGSFVLGPVMVLVAALHHSNGRQLRLLTAGAMALISLLNPYGWRLHALVWSYLVGTSAIHREIHARVLEFRNLWGAWGTVIDAQDVIGWSLAAAVACLAFTDRRHRILAAFCLLMLFAGARNVRHLQLGGLLTGWLLAPWVDERLRRLTAFQVSNPRWQKAALGATLVPALALGAVLLPQNLARRESREWVHEGESFFDVWSTVDPGAHVYLPFARAGLAIWYGFPSGIRVFFDPRNDCYSATTFKDYMRLSKADGSTAWIRDTLRRAGTTTVVIPDGHPLSSVLRDTGDWRLTGPRGEWQKFVWQGHRTVDLGLGRAPEVEPLLDSSDRAIAR